MTSTVQQETIESRTDARTDRDDTAAPLQDSDLGQRYYYTEPIEQVTR